MLKKYKHIKLPNGLVGTPSAHILGTRPNPQGLLPLTADQDTQRRMRIGVGLSKVEDREQSIEEASSIDQEGYYELKVTLRRGGNKELLERLKIEPYRKSSKSVEVVEGDEIKKYQEETVIGRVSTVRLRDENQSNFDKLKTELNSYLAHNELPSYYDQINDIQPLTLEEVAEKGLIDDFASTNLDEAIMVDIVFADSTESSEIKMSSLESDYTNAFLVKVNTTLSHYCRMTLTESEIKTIMDKYKGIIELTHAPIFIASEGQLIASDDINPIDQTSTSANPIIIADQPISATHPLLHNVLVDRMGNTTFLGNHGSQVGSLAVSGKSIPLRGDVVQKNKIIGLNAFVVDPISRQTTINENLITDAVQTYQSSSKALLINLSANSTSRFYDRSAVNHLTVFLDELAHDFNCLFVISAGNMNEVNNFYAAGIPYPDYFDEEYTTILPPADSINNLTVGSITYQESPDSIARLENPSPITRRGFDDKKFGFIKPDLVHFDSNCILRNNVVEPEYNGPNLATADTGITKNIGTSFAAPLVVHELGLLAGYYPSYRAQTLKALVIHFSQVPNNLPTAMQPERVVSLVGHGQTRIDDTLNSLNTASTLVLEDTIQIKSSKKVAIPIPSAIAGAHNRRLRIRVTLAYNPIPNNSDIACYCPINISARIDRDDDRPMSTATTQSYLNGAHKKSNLKKYPSIEKNTTAHTGTFWNIVLTADPIGDSLPDTYKQAYSMIVTIEDMDRDDEIDIHEEVSQMIEVRTHTTIEIEV